MKTIALMVLFVVAFLSTLVLLSVVAEPSCPPPSVGRAFCVCTFDEPAQFC